MTTANNKDLKAVVIEIMANFKQDWFKRMVDWHTMHYNRIQELKPEVQKWLRKYDNLHSKYWRNFYFKHKSLESILDHKKKRYERILCDKAATTRGFDRYMQEVDSDLRWTWITAINRLVEKCKKFNIDLDKIQVSNPKIVAKGFEVYITDGKPRRIYARMIWAAEFSDLVEPHTRYIVTEKKIK